MGHHFAKSKVPRPPTSGLSAPIAAYWESMWQLNPLLVGLLAALAGIVSDVMLLERWSTGWFCLAGLTVVGSAIWMWRRGDTGSGRLAFFALFFAAGFARHHGHWHGYPDHEIGHLVGEVRETVQVRGVVCGEPRWFAPSPGGSLARTREPGYLLPLRAQRLRRDADWQVASGNLTVFVTAPSADQRAGDIVEVRGRISRIEGQRNPREFDFAEYYRGQRRLVTMYANDPADVVTLGHQFSPLTRLRSKLRAELDRQIGSHVAGERSALASAILLGNREQLSHDERDLFLHTGTVHLLAISGLHIGILSGSLFWLLRLGLISRRLCLLSVICMVLVYAWLVEFRAPVTRSAIWIALFCLTRLFGERAFSFNLLAASALIVLAINPHDAFQIGPQFSFLAVAMLIVAASAGWLTPREDAVTKLIFVTRPWMVRGIWQLGRWGRQAFLCSALIWLATLPLVAVRYSVISPIGLLVNPLVLLPMACALYGGLIVMVCGWWCPPLAILGGWLCQASLQTIESLIGFADRFPCSHFWSAGPELWAVAAFYGVLLVVASYPSSPQVRRWAFAAVAMLLIAGWWVPSLRAERMRELRSEVRFTFVDVGHGTSVLIETPSGQVMLYDGGSFGSVQRAGRAVSANLWAERIKHIDVMMISHADVDHYNALPTLLERFSLGRLYVTRQVLHSTAPSVIAMFDAVQAEGIPVSCLTEGSQLAIDEHVQMQILSPPRDGVPGTENANSLVLLLEMYGQTVILPGDLEGAGIERLLGQSIPACTLAMAPHHGSMSSKPAQFARWSRPQTVVISGARNRINPKCIEAYRTSGALVLATGYEGAIRLSVAADGLRWQTWFRDGLPLGRRRFADDCPRGLTAPASLAISPVERR